MSHSSNFGRFFRVFCLGAVSMAAITPVHAQRGEGNQTPTYHSPSLSDTTLPEAFPQFTLLPGRGLPPQFQAISITPFTQILVANTGTPTLKRDAVAFNTSLDNLMPFAGCINVNWKAYNEALKTASQLRASLALETGFQLQQIAADPSPEKLARAAQVVKVIEDTTTVLEKATDILVFLGKSFDQGR